MNFIAIDLLRSIISTDRLAGVFLTNSGGNIVTQLFKSLIRLLNKTFMKKIIGLLILSLALFSCNKDNPAAPRCDIQKIYTENEAKVTITNGIWGTIASMEGNCMPMLPSSSSCQTCAAKRTVKIYEYTLPGQATRSGNSPSFFDSFSTRLVAQVDADENGFYQTTIPAGHYTIVIVENGQLYANGSDGQGGISPVTYTTGKLNVNLTMTYKAVF